MTVAWRGADGVRVWRCDACGREGRWDSHWRQYSSILMEETCPDDIPTMCSSDCVSAWKKLMREGKVSVPRIAKQGLRLNIKQERKGY